MADPFDVLRSPLTPIAPDPAFAARLRARVAAALRPSTDPEGDTMTNATPVADDQLDPAATPLPSYAARHGDLAYVSLWVDDVDRAADFYAAVLGWRYRAAADTGSRQVEGLSIHHGIWDGDPQRTLFVCIAVDDLADAVRRVRSAGGTATDPHDEPYGSISDCTDDQGMPFALYQATPGGERGPANGERHGDVSYVTIEVVDSARFRAFFGHVVGWRFSPGRVEDGWGVEDTVPMLGIHGGHDVATGVPMYRVDDIHAAVAAVRAAGGTATDPDPQPYAITSTCADDQGTRFYLGQH